MEKKEASHPEYGKINWEDVSLVIKQTECSKEKALKALQ